MNIKTTVLFAGFMLGSSGVAIAQAPPAPTTPPAATAPPASGRASSDCAPTQTSPQQGTIVPRDTTTGRANEPLADKLARSDGVLCPPSGVDPEMHAPTPDTGNTPVIPPPGSPGGNPSVIPK